ncbi:succinate dehydrogenase cytochrome b560 subunit, mitochondrial-like [Liolophura sinensis]|uniref:succinate dehydrogenase cytochrome b560 subunit, mitochondrial-like n=1 Tax=Liolophura sinensis TaxID=3198878 RepID=UPI0031590CBD
MSLLLRTVGRQCLLRYQSPLIRRIMPMSSSAYNDMKDFWEKNNRLQRPLSPHLSIYKPQLTSMLSLAHRATGIAMAISVSAASIALLAIPGDFTHCIQVIKDLQLHPYILYSAKSIMAWPLVYHYINGIRHLSWDAGKGFSMNATYKSGYFVLLLSFIVTDVFVFAWPLW